MIEKLLIEVDGKVVKEFSGKEEREAKKYANDIALDGDSNVNVFATRVKVVYLSDWQVLRKAIYKVFINE